MDRRPIGRVDDWPGWLKALVLAVEIALIMLLAPQLVRADGYVPLTHDQAARYIDANREGAIADIVRLDWIEHAQGSLSMPGIVFALRGRDLSWGYDPPEVTVTVPGPGPTDPAASWTFPLPGGSRKDFAPPGNELDLWLWRAATVVGVFVGYEVGRGSR